MVGLGIVIKRQTKIDIASVVVVLFFTYFVRLIRRPPPAPLNEEKLETLVLQFSRSKRWILSGSICSAFAALIGLVAFKLWPLRTSPFLSQVWALFLNGPTHILKSETFLGK